MTTEDNSDYLWERRFKILWRVWISALYHRKRERFFDACDRTIKAVAVIGASAAFSKVVDPWLVPWITAGIAVSSTISLVFGLSDRARRHAELAGNFKKLESEIELAGERDFAENHLNKWRARITELESTEPATLFALVELCEQELNLAQGTPKNAPVMGFWRKALAQFWSFKPPRMTGDAAPSI